MRSLLLLLLLAGCSIAPGCYVGVALLPPSPFVHCGADVNKVEPAMSAEEYPG